MTEDKRAISSPLPPEPSHYLPPPDMTASQELAARSAAGQENAPRQPATAPLGPALTAAALNRVDSNMQPARPIQEVVDAAFQDSPAKDHIDAEMINMIVARVTDEVTKNLTRQQRAATSSLSPISQPIPHPIPQPIPIAPGSATLSPADPFRFTPPSPDMHHDNRDLDSTSPGPPASDAGSQFSQRSRASTRSSDILSRGEAIRPAAAKTDSEITIRAQVPANTAIPLQRRDSESERTPGGKWPTRMDSKLSETASDAASRAKAAPPMQASETGETALERAWQPLFKNGQPTRRLGAFLRGIAVHLINDYEPKESLVVTPSKMLRFFNETKVDEEYYPWNKIFAQLAFPSISMLYRKLGCPHHFVQKAQYDEPIVPGLTPHGFEGFMIYLIQAHPDIEFERLAKAVMNMPISSAEDRTHRFPKELSRRLLPSRTDLPSRQRLEASMQHEPSVLAELKDRVGLPPPPPPASLPRSQTGPLPASLPERQRQPYSQSSNLSNMVNDEDLGASSVPIERERKPYTGSKEGTGRIYASEESRPPFNHYKTDTGSARSSRANSGIPPQGMYPPPPTSSVSEPVNIPPRAPQHRHSISGQSNQQQGANLNYTRAMRGRTSSPPRNGYVNSDPYNVANIPDQQFMSNLHPTVSNPTPGSYNEEAYRASVRAYPPPNRSTPVSTPYDFQPGSMGGPVGDAPPPGSYPSRRPTQQPPPSNPPPPHRRQSVFTGPSMTQGSREGGTDGYGSYVDSMNGGYPP